jgi:heme exporter protein A
MFLQADQLVAARGARALIAPLSFSVGSGEALLVSGANGSGKSTLLRTLASLLPAFSGTVVRPSGFTFIGHKNALEPSLDVFEQLAFWKNLFSVDANGVDALGLTPLYRKRISELSEGQRRRVALARLFINPQPLWLLDEPHAALDASGLSLLHDLIRAHRQKGGGVILASHSGLALESAGELQLRTGVAL